MIQLEVSEIGVAPQYQANSIHRAQSRWVGHLGGIPDTQNISSASTPAGFKQCAARDYTEPGASPRGDLWSASSRTYHPWIQYLINPSYGSNTSVLSLLLLAPRSWPDWLLVNIHDQDIPSPRKDHHFSRALNVHKRCLLRHVYPHRKKMYGLVYFNSHWSYRAVHLPNNSPNLNVIWMINNLSHDKTAKSQPHNLLHLISSVDLHASMIWPLVSQDMTPTRWALPTRINQIIWLAGNKKLSEWGGRYITSCTVHVFLILRSSVHDSTLYCLGTLRWTFRFFEGTLWFCT